MHAIAFARHSVALPAQAPWLAYNRNGSWMALGASFPGENPWISREPRAGSSVWIMGIWAGNLDGSGCVGCVEQRGLTVWIAQRMGQETGVGA
jgi:hypothetical protein